MSNSGIGQFIPLILIFVIFYFFLIRPQQKKAKDHKTMVENLKRGDKVVTTGGIVGRVERIISRHSMDQNQACQDEREADRCMIMLWISLMELRKITRLLNNFKNLRKISLIYF